jgi:adenylylsulfate kinase
MSKSVKVTAVDADFDSFVCDAYLAEAGIIELTAFIAHLRGDRERVRGTVEHGDFIEIYCDSPIEVCETRDVKGLYKKARAGQIRAYTGVSSPYEAPVNPELTVNTGGDKLDARLDQVIKLMSQRGADVSPLLIWLTKR